MSPPTDTRDQEPPALGDNENEHEEKEKEKEGKPGNGAGKAADPAGTGDKPAEQAGGGSESSEGGPAKSSLDTTQRIEVDLATYGAVTAIAEAIVERCSAPLEARTGALIIVPTAAAHAMAAAQVLEIELKSLATALDKLAGDDGSSLEFLKAITPAAVTGTFAALEKSAQSLFTAVEKLGVKDVYSGRSVGIDEPALMAAVGGQLASSREVIMIGGDAPFPTPTPRSFQRLAGALERARSAKLDEEARKKLEMLQASLDKALAPLRDAGAAAMLGLKLLAALDRSSDALILTVRSLSAGGAYRERTHLLTMLGFVDKLSFSAGAALVFTLTSAKEGRLLASDIVYHSTDRLQTPSATRRTLLSNSGSRRGQGGPPADRAASTQLP